MTAWRSTPGSAQERRARRALVNGLDDLVGTFAAAKTQPGASRTTLPCRDDLLGGLKERTMAAVEPVSGESQLKATDICASQPEVAARQLIDAGFTERTTTTRCRH